MPDESIIYLYASGVVLPVLVIVGFCILASVSVCVVWSGSYTISAGKLLNEACSCSRNELPRHDQDALFLAHVRFFITRDPFFGF